MSKLFLAINVACAAANLGAAIVTSNPLNWFVCGLNTAAAIMIIVGMANQNREDDHKAIEVE